MDRATRREYKPLSIRNDTFRATLCLDRIDNLPLVKIRKLFTLLASAEWENRESVAQLDADLPDLVAQAKAAWGEYSRAYQDGYKCPNGVPGEYVPPTETRKRKANNKRLMDDVKKSKATYEKWVKICDIWKELKTKFKID